MPKTLLFLLDPALNGLPAVHNTDMDVGAELPDDELTGQPRFIVDTIQEFEHLLLLVAHVREETFVFLRQVDMTRSAGAITATFGHDTD